VGFERRTIHHHDCRACRVRWEPVSRIKCPDSRTGERRRGRAFALEARRFAQCCFYNQGSSGLETMGVRSTLFPSPRLGSISVRYCGPSHGFDQRVLCRGVSRLTPGSVFYPFLGISVWVPLIDILDSSPEPLLEHWWSSWGLLMIGFPWGGARATPTGVAPEALEESDSFEGLCSLSSGCF